jgi:hypothetical protein
VSSLSNIEVAELLQVIIARVLAFLERELCPETRRA